MKVEERLYAKERTANEVKDKLAQAFNEMGYSQKAAQAKVKNYTGIIIGGCQRNLPVKTILDKVFERFTARPSNYADIWTKPSFEEFVKTHDLPLSTADAVPLEERRTDGVRGGYEPAQGRIDPNYKEFARLSSR